MKVVQAFLAQPGVLLVLKTLASLVGVLFVVQLARWMNLGGDVRIRDEDHAGALADEAMCGFVPVAVGLDKARIGALVRDAQGRVMLIAAMAATSPRAFWKATPASGSTSSS